MVRNRLPAQRGQPLALERRATHVENFSRYFLSFKCLSTNQTKKTINVLLLDHFYPVTSYRPSSEDKESDELLCTVLVTRYGPRNQLPERKAVKVDYRTIILH